MRVGLRALFSAGALFGCSGDEGSSGAGGSGAGVTPSYYEDVAPIVREHCLSCHVTGGIAPLELDSYEEVSAIAGLVADQVETRQMPPWHVDNSGACNTWQDARWLSEADIATVRAWVEAATPEGDPSLAEDPPPPPGGLEQVSISLDIGFDYAPDETLSDDYRCFVIDPELASDAFITAYEVKPGDPAVVHHVILYASDSAEGDAQALAADADDPGPGFECFGDAGIDGGAFVAGWAPGTPPTRYPADVGLPLDAGRLLVAQLHYNTANLTGTDRTSIDLTLADDVDRPAQFSLMRAGDLFLPPGMSEVEASATETSPAPIPIQIYGAYPHMHRRGRSLRVDVARSGESQCIVDVPDWDFNWQQLYLYEEPLLGLPGDLVTITCSYDTTADTEVVTWGEGTEDEMCLSFFLVGP